MLARNNEQLDPWKTLPDVSLRVLQIYAVVYHASFRASLVCVLSVFFCLVCLVLSCFVLLCLFFVCLFCCFFLFVYLFVVLIDWRFCLFCWPALLLVVALHLFFGQNRLQRCTMDCADEAKDSIPPGAKAGDAAVDRAMTQVKLAPASRVHEPCFIFSKQDVSRRCGGISLKVFQPLARITLPHKNSKKKS